MQKLNTLKHCVRSQSHFEN